jgi:hypothetical protein
MTYRERAQRPESRFELRPAPGYWVVGALATLLAVVVAGVVIVGAQRHGAPPVGVLVRGTAGLAVVAIFWFGTAAYRVRGAIVVDDDHVSLVDARGHTRWRLPVREVGFELSGEVVVLSCRAGTQRLSARVFRSEADIERLRTELLMRAAGESAVANLDGLFNELFAEFFNRPGASELPADPAEKQLDARVDEELRKLD